MKKLSSLALLVSFSILTAPALAMHPYMSFDDLVQKADLVFEGEVVDMQCRYGPNQQMIFTDVTFRVEKAIYVTESAASRFDDPVVLTFAGGEIGGERVTVSGTPVFKVAARYLVFTRLDGKTYASPILGGTQGLFQVQKDTGNGKDYPLTYGGSAILGFDGPHLFLGPPVSGIERGEAKSTATVPDLLYRVPPKRTGGGPGGRLSSSMMAQSRSQAVQPIDLDRLISEIYTRIK
jgi:hypothetical protein